VGKISLFLLHCHFLALGDNTFETENVFKGNSPNPWNEEILKFFSIMKLEKLTSSKFISFRAKKISSLNRVRGGSYKGETGTATQYDQECKSGAVMYSDKGQGGRNDGFDSDSWGDW